MAESRRALITGITGQDGSYLAEFLLEKGYEVHGMVRRSSTETFQRLQGCRDDLILHTGDLLDQRSMVDVLRDCEPDEIYNLAAMSFVAASWNQPVLTAEFSGVGATKMLEAMREVTPEARFYQASSSEMFGKVREVPQTETTPFYPRSPYGVAKVYGHFITVNYRESYDLFACSGILFNHECVSGQTPLMVRENGVVSVKTPADLVPFRRKGPNVQSFEPAGLLEVWDGHDWTPVQGVTATRRRRTDPDHRLLCVRARAGSVEVTAHHAMLSDELEEVPAGMLEAGDRLALSEALPAAPGWTVVSEEMGEFLGLMAAGGWVAAGSNHARFINNDGALRLRVAELWSRLFLGSTRATDHASGRDPDRRVQSVELQGAPEAAPWLRGLLYTKTGVKQVPAIVLNADAEGQEGFLRGYYAGDGPKRGNGESIETNNAVLAQGLCWLYDQADQPASVWVENRAGTTYYQVNLRSRRRVGSAGRDLLSDPADVREVSEGADEEWVFDLQTQSGRFCAGVGRIIVHNSPRRGLEFVTRKVTHGAASIKLGLSDELALGNLDAERDWGYAKDYVEAMWLMLQEEQADDFVVATGQTHSVRELVDLAFGHVGLDPDEHVRVDPRFLRPAEVEHLIGDASKARERLSWRPGTSFEELVRLMVDADLELLASGAPQKQAG